MTHRNAMAGYVDGIGVDLHSRHGGLLCRKSLTLNNLYPINFFICSGQLAWTILCKDGRIADALDSIA